MGGSDQFSYPDVLYHLGLGFFYENVLFGWLLTCIFCEDGLFHSGGRV